MSNIAGVNENIGLVRKSYRKFVSLGEGATSDDFRMTVEGYPDLEFLIQASQLPPLAREPIEGFGPHGVQFTQQGRYKNIAEVPITFKEVLSGEVYKTVREWVLKKMYLKITLALLGESDPQSNPNTTVVFEDTWIELEGVDVSVEDATLIKPTGTLHVNWLSYLDPESETLDWGL
ncbi:MAG TPA: hypothetical protein ENN86_02510 [Desulfobacteraceae bacterium]|nr:hypothetical protein [Desulfobacteraceae bacterium]